MDHRKPADLLVYLLFFLSGVSGLVYEVIWVRIFGNLFGNTAYSAAIVTSVFMLGLGLGSYLAGVWSDKRHATGKPPAFLRNYGQVELGVALLGLLVVLALPVLRELSGSFARYVSDGQGWRHLSCGSHLGRMGAAVILMLPVTTLMGATLTLLIRHLLSGSLSSAGWRIGVLYGCNTAGAALGCFATDLFLVPLAGLLRTQLAAVAINAAVGAAAILLAGRSPATAPPAAPTQSPAPSPGLAQDRLPSGTVAFIALALFFSGFAAMGMEMVWFRFLSSCLGAYRVVFSLMLTVVLIGIWLGSLAGGYSVRRWGKPVERAMLVQAVFIVVTPLLLIAFDGPAAEAFLMKRLLPLAANEKLPLLTEIWGVARPILGVIGLPSFLVGFSFPLANAFVQRLEQRVGRRAGGLYLANTLGAVLGALAAGFIMLPGLGSQRSVLFLCFVSALAIVALQAARLREPAGARRLARHGFFALCLLGAGVILVGWSRLPAPYFMMKGFPRLAPDIRVLASAEGLNESLIVIEDPAGDRFLLTNGHSMSGTAPRLQRYMRAFVHIPLLQMDSPRSVLVICFGVGNTLHAASLHPTIQRLDTVDLSEQIFAHARFFRESNGDVLADDRVAVYVNDGRLHLQMAPPASYDLITLEPPPITFAGTASLYSREFYRLARSRLKDGGFMTQWLPLYQVSPEVGLSMVRAFVDVFPNAVLLSGMQKELILMGRAAAASVIDPARLALRLAGAPRVRSDLERMKMGTLTEILGTFVAHGEDLRRATRRVEPVTDDNRSMEYGIFSKFSDTRLPRDLFHVEGIAAWCPDCLENGSPRPGVGPLREYLAAQDLMYRSDAFLFFRRAWGSMGGSDVDFIDRDGRLGTVVSRSPYLREVLASPLTGSLKKIILRGAVGAGSVGESSRAALGSAHADLSEAMRTLRSNRFPESIGHFRRAVERDGENASARFGLAYALFYANDLNGSMEQYRRGLAIAPNNIDARLSLAAVLRQAGLVENEREELAHVLRLEPGCLEAASRLRALR